MAAEDDRLDTSRLILRRFRDDDVGPLAEMNADPEVMRFIGTGRVIERAETAAMLTRMRAHWAEHGFGRWAVELREDGRFVGFCGVGYLSFAPELLTSPEIGWRLARSTTSSACRMSATSPRIGSWRSSGCAGSTTSLPRRAGASARIASIERIGSHWWAIGKAELRRSSSAPPRGSAARRSRSGLRAHGAAPARASLVSDFA